MPLDYFQSWGGASTKDFFLIRSVLFGGSSPSLVRGHAMAMGNHQIN